MREFAKLNQTSKPNFYDGLYEYSYELTQTLDHSKLSNLVQDTNTACVDLSTLLTNFNLSDAQILNSFADCALIPTTYLSYLSENNLLPPTGRTVLPDYYQLATEYNLTTDTDVSSIVDALSTPDTKLYYPEPFIASPSFVHEDLWFIHILHYQHWLWFMFISLIMFYFVTFINVVRWCNLRTKPKRETRGVSRSKCADLITATVPVTWATSIIVSESVDAADYYDGFGSGEIVIGIRAYQWGWEYFYPKGIDLNYNVSPSYSALVGNSLKYTTASTTTLKSNNLWKFYQSSSSNASTSTPGHVLLSPTDNAKVLNFLEFSNLGSDLGSDTAAFKKIQYFSKTNPQNLYSDLSDFTLKYNKIAALYLNSSEPLRAANYGTLRQHNHVSGVFGGSGSQTTQDPVAFSKYLAYNQNLQVGSDKYLPANLKGTARLSEASTPALLNDALAKVDHVIPNSTSYPLKSALSGAETDAKSATNPLKYALSSKFSKKNFVNNSWSGTGYTSSSVTVPAPQSQFTTNLLNESVSYRFRDLKSPATTFLTSERNSRLLNNITLNSPSKNFNPQENSLQATIADISTNTVASPVSRLLSQSASLWAPNTTVARLTNNSTALATNHTPLPTHHAFKTALSFDKFLPNESDLTPNLLKSKEESAPVHVFSAYWDLYWAQSNSNNRLTNLTTGMSATRNSYLPMITDYVEYDFKNWQSLELLEDAIWESSYSSFAHEDYLNLFEENTKPVFFKKQEELFNSLNRASSPTALAKPFFRDLTKGTTLNALPVFAEESSPHPLFLSTKNFWNFGNETAIDTMDDAYENFKYLNTIYSSNYITILNSRSSNIQPLSYAQVLDTFRPGYEEASWYNDTAQNNTDYSDADLPLDSAQIRLSNPMQLRSSARNSIITYNAIQKVFKSRFDEGRSHARLQDVSNSYTTHPFISEPKAAYESMLGKNTETFFNTNFYKPSLATNYNPTMSNWNSTNTYFFDIPFLLSMKSDASRYLWFDWQARWSSIEIQPSSVARYSLLGLPYNSKSFEYSTGPGEELNDSENYLIKLSRARKNYMSNWARTPYFYERISNWYASSDLDETFLLNTSITNLKTLLKASHQFYDSSNMSRVTDSTALVLESTPSSSGVNTAGRSSWRPSTGIQSFYYTSSVLTDILSRREYLYRQLFNHAPGTAYLPRTLTASPNNPILTEVKNTYSLSDPLLFSAEVSREMFYSNTNLLQLTLIRELLTMPNQALSNAPVNLKLLSNYASFYLFNTTTTSNDLSGNLNMYKSQFRPMKKGVTNMIRLHATNAIAMPIEVRLHILASSKDVIHSWAIPSAGIKIDCVPGYSSHRIAIFLVSGIFWGQCMEICGRFHHWMPIIVYFMKRDLFFLWCTHFMHYSSSTNSFNMSDRQLTDHTRQASYDTSSWVQEFTNTF